MEEDQLVKIEKWYRSNISTYEILAKKMENLVKDILESQKLDYYQVQSRAKTFESFKNKMQKKGSDDPLVIQDLCGIRIITFVKSQVDQIVALLRQHFEIDRENSVDKAIDLGIDKVGYISKHLIVSLSGSRLSLPEFQIFTGRKFEIQVRTILQHAWAETEHDRNYKFSGILPPEIQRRFRLLSGLLEVADNEFDQISKLVDEYSEDVSEKAKVGNLDIPINTTSLRQYLSDRFGSVGGLVPEFGPGDNVATLVIKELGDMGIVTLEQLDKIIPIDFKSMLEKDALHYRNFAGIIRNILMIHNKDRYFKDAWHNSWGGLKRDTDEAIFKHYGIDIDEIEQFLKKNYKHEAK